MTIAEAKVQIREIRDCLIDVEQCKDDVEAFTVALQCMEYFHGLRNNLDVAYTLASRHYEHGVMDGMKKLLDEVSLIK